jgi:diguanylate cyclase (GGDEF)-like protein
VTTPILIVDDEVAVSQVFADILQRYGDYKIVVETDGHQVISRLQREKYELILLDIMLPGLNGLELLRQIKEQFDDVPVIMVTGYGSIELAVEAMQIGAADFVTKPVEASVLHIRVRKALDHARTKRLASTDGLTGLYNHRVFQERLEEEVERANRYHRPLSLLMVDVDHFKVHNDTHGHLWGDAILTELARLLKDSSRTSDIVARYGGEEFVLVLPETNQDQALNIANRLRETIASHRFLDTHPAKSLTVSIGVAMHQPAGCKQTLIAAADGALYTAKRTGRNRVCAA